MKPKSIGVKSARRLAELGPSKIRGLLELSRGMDGVINLGIGEPDFDTPWHIRQAYASALKDGHTRYASSMGDAELRQGIADKYKREHGICYDPNSEVLVTNGGVEAIYLAVNSLAGPGDEVIVPDPGYLVYPGCIQVAEARPVGWPSLELDVGKLNEMITRRTKMVILNHPSNPTGMTIGKEKAKAVAEIVTDNNLILLSDEVYEKIVHDGNHVNMASLGILDRTITINSFSKTYAMTGLRVGYGVGPNGLIHHMAKLHQYTTSCINSAAQRAAVAALAGPQGCVDRMAREYKERRDLLVKGLNEVEGISCPMPGGAFYTFPDIRETEIGSEHLATKLLREAKVATVPGNAFGSLGEGHLRLSYATSREEIEEALKRIRNLLA